MKLFTSVFDDGVESIRAGEALDSEGDLAIEVYNELTWIDKQAAIKLIAHIQEVFDLGGETQ